MAAVKPDLKVQRGSTGVELRFYKPSEFRCLSAEQRKELKAMRAEQKGERKRKKSEDKKPKAANVKAQQFIKVTEQLDASDDEDLDYSADILVAAMHEGK